jgi:hypothetical protein
MHRHVTLMRSIYRRRTRACAPSQPSPRAGYSQGQRIAFLKHSAVLPRERRSAGQVSLPRSPPRKFEIHKRYSPSLFSEQKAVDSSDFFSGLNAGAGVESEKSAIESSEGEKEELDDNADGHVDEKDADMDEIEKDYSHGETDNDAGGGDGKEGN